MNSSSITRITVLSLALGAVAGCSLLKPSAPGDTPATIPTDRTLEKQGTRPLDGEQTRALLNHARYRWESAAGAKGNGVTFGDGNLRIFWETGAINGRIRFNDTGYCSRFKDVRNNAEDCYRLYPDGPRQYRVYRSDGHYSGRITLIDTRRY
ncbi:MAG: hypothetical protein Q4A16_00835 [Lautropia sp.]|nr:hypothetical protein [Lautropia sp.]